MSIIPRNATKLRVVFKVNTSAHDKGQSVMVTKRNEYWSDGKYMYLVDMLRNKDVCDVQVIQ